MGETTVRIAPKQRTRKEIKEQIDALRALLSHGFDSNESLQAALPFLTNDQLNLRFLAQIEQPFEKVKATTIMRLIAAQISFLENELETAGE